MDFLPEDPNNAAADDRFAQVDTWRTLHNDLKAFLPEVKFPTAVVNGQGQPMDTTAIMAEAEQRYAEQLKAGEYEQV